MRINPILLATQFGHWLFQRPAPQNQFSSNMFKNHFRLTSSVNLFNSNLRVLQLLICLYMSASSLVAFAGDIKFEAINNPSEPDGKPHIMTFGGEGNQWFLLDGKPLQIRCAEMHIQAIPRESWRRTVRMAKAMGMNSVSTYLYWGEMEKPDGTFDFKTGSRDLAGFLKMCMEEKMWVNLRPGPYVCSERDLGGMPPRLLKHKDIKFRTTENKRYMEPAEAFLKEVAKICRPYLVKNGGPILLTQLDNEYGSYDRKDPKYYPWLKTFWENEGFGPFNTSDGPGARFLSGENITLEGVALGLDPGENDANFNESRPFLKNAPVFCGEFYPGWIRHWGENNWAPVDKLGVVDYLMKNGYSFNMYVIAGGTNFGITAGANGFNNAYQPDLTSYDFGAPLNEDYNTTPAYFSLANKIKCYLAGADKVPQPDGAVSLLSISPFELTRIGGIYDRLPKPMRQELPNCFESWDQNQGLAIYETILKVGPAEDLEFERVSDYAKVYVDGQLLATLDRREGNVPKKTTIPTRTKPVKLSVLVEGMGHVGYSTVLESDRKGILGMVKLGSGELKGWSVFPIPLKEKEVTKFKPMTAGSLPVGGRFRGQFIIVGKVLPTYFDMSKYTKGFLFVNGFNLGRFWKVGPQFRLYCPASFLKSGVNIVDVVDIEQTQSQPISSFDTNTINVSKAQ